MLLACIEAVVFGIAIVASLFKHSISNIVLTCAVALHDSLNKIFGHILIVGKKLLGVLRQTVATITERRIIIMCTDARIKSYTFNNSLAVQTLHLGISVKLIEIAHTQCQISIGKQLNSLSLLSAHKQARNTLVEC